MKFPRRGIDMRREKRERKERKEERGGRRGREGREGRGGRRKFLFINCFLFEFFPFFLIFDFSEWE